ncbi:phosphotransferase family protein [Aspergillus ibericus CBS 121593]|uniref:Phosphotransferase family protein n=1 Tax=Aspergillus ibericus CBS 121593 TaxID=1448316 RepID=A0A395GL42_9EURO|nr:phosphotransferase family protein [Aspergillus ibericus CBS 121593]RAK95537.1 phosphotransferase family protein [Aspergillus ibericus CBS 121593]
MNDNRRLFEYTSGRWIYNENLRLAERHREFNVDALKSTAAQSLERCDTDIKSLSKLAEGGFNRVLQITMLDNTQVLVRLPYPSTEPKKMAVASEVATLALLRAHGLPVPRVYAYSTDAKNAVGSEYIIMEKLPGRPLGDRWFALSDRERLKVLLQLVQLEAKLHAIELPASGSIYYASDLPSDSPRIVIPDSDFCISPDAALKWWFAERASLRIDRGPWEDPIDVLRNPALKELAWLRAYGRPRFPFERAYRESMDYRLSDPSEHIASLESYLKIAPALLPSNELSRPPNNIFVSDDLDIVGLIDWQHASVLPLFLASGIPKFFQNYDDPESLHFRPPPRPDLEGMDEEEKADILHDFQRRHTHFFYLAFTQRFNEPHFRAMEHATNMLTRRIFNHASEPWEGNNIPLQADLVLLTKSWHEYSTDPCPVSFSTTRADSIMHLQGLQEEVDLQLKQIRNVIGIGVDGWTPAEDYEAACARARQMKVDGLASLDTDHEREMTNRHWPFDDHNEDE